jgi:hypothetical protein
MLTSKQFTYADKQKINKQCLQGDQVWKVRLGAFQRSPRLVPGNLLPEEGAVSIRSYTCMYLNTCVHVYASSVHKLEAAYHLIICIHILIYAYKRTINAYTYIRTRISTPNLTHAYVCKFICMYIHTYTCIHTCTG